MEDFDVLKLQNQLCFPLYVCSKEVIKKYKPLLDELELTYTSYLVMMALWEKDELTVNSLGELLWLDSGTLTPLLKKMENLGLILRNRKASDERVVVITLTDKGSQLKNKAAQIPFKLSACLDLSQEESAVLYKLLYKIIEKV